MSREIKFRAWNGYAKKMYYTGDYFYLTIGQVGEWFTGPKDYVGFKVDINGTGASCIYSDESKHHLMQYTCLKDKNGREIYEGDVVRCVDKHDEESVLLVRYVQKRAAFRYVNADCADSEWVSEIGMFDNGEEVIGNIYENSELITTP